MIARSIQAKLLVFAVFFIGIATGALVDNIYSTRVISATPKPVDSRGGDRLSPQERQKRDEDSMAKYLGLDQSQKDQVHKILTETWGQMQDLRAQVEPQFKAIEDASRARIRLVLTDEQRKKGDAYREAHKGNQGNRGRSPRPQDNQDKDKK